MKYHIVSGNADDVSGNAEEVIKEVNEKLADGWELYGDLTASPYRIYQIMVKHDD